MGHRPRGLQRQRRRVELFHPRSVAVSCLPLGRRRTRGPVRRPAALVLRPGVVERARPDPERAPVRAHQQRGEPRRRRQGVLLLRRQHAHALVHEVSVQVPAAGVSLPGPGRHEPEPITARARIRAARHGRLRPGPLFRRVRGIREGGPGRRPRSHHGAQSWTGGGQAACAADALVPQYLVVGRRSAQAVPSRGATRRHSGHASAARRVLAVVRWRTGAALHREREQRLAPLGSAQCVSLRQGRVPRVRRRGPRRRGQSGEGRHQGGGPLRPRRARWRQHDGQPAPREHDGSEGRRPRRNRRRLPRVRADPREPHRGCGRVLRANRAAGAERRRTARAPPGAGRHALEQAVLPLRPRALAARPEEPSAARCLPARRAEHRVVSHAQRRRDFHAGQVGVPVVRGLGPRVSHRLAGAGGFRLRQGSAPADAAQPLCPSQRADPGLRVELQRRQSARARLGDPAVCTRWNGTSGGKTAGSSNGRFTA